MLTFSCLFRPSSCTDWSSARGGLASLNLLGLLFLLVSTIFFDTVIAQDELADEAREKLRDKYFLAEIDSRMLAMWANATYRKKPLLSRNHSRHDGLSWRERELGLGVRLFGLEPEGTVVFDLAPPTLPQYLQKEDYHREQEFLQFNYPQMSRNVHVGRVTQRYVSRYITRFEYFPGYTDDLALEIDTVLFQAKGGISWYPLPRYTEWERFHCYVGIPILRFKDNEKATAELERRSEAKDTTKPE